MGNGQGSGAEKRKELRKQTNLPVEIGQLVSPASTLGEESSKKRPIRRKPEHVMKVSLSFEALDEGEIINISSLGLALATKIHFASGKKIGVTFLIADTLTGEQNPIFAKCIVRWSSFDSKRGYIMGLEFLLMDQEDANSLSKFLERLPEAPN